MAIPFIRKFPSGRRGLQEVLRDPQIELKAAEFIDHAGRYLIEVLPDGKVHLMAIIDLAEGCKLVAEETAPNGPELLEATDRLIIESNKHIPIPLYRAEKPALTLVR